MRQVFFSFFILLFCLISSCTKENIKTFDDKIYKTWDVQTSSRKLIGVDTILNEEWRTTDTTFFTMTFTDTLVTSIILDSLLNIKPGKADTLKFPFSEFDTDLIKIGNDTYYIKNLTSTGMQLEHRNTFFDTPPFHTEERFIWLRAL